jgi:hypothetical protein
VEHPDDRHPHEYCRAVPEVSPTLPNLCSALESVLERRFPILATSGKPQPFDLATERDFCVSTKADNMEYVFANIDADRGQGRRRCYCAPTKWSNNDPFAALHESGIGP